MCGQIKKIALCFVPLNCMEEGFTVYRGGGVRRVLLYVLQLSCLGEGKNTGPPVNVYDTVLFLRLGLLCL
jgi:hypothetical protein